MNRNFTIKPNKSLSNSQLFIFLAIMIFLTLFIGVRFLFLGAWPILIFGMVEISLLIFCTYVYLKYSKQKERISINNKEITIIKKDSKKSIIKGPFNISWVRFSEIDNQIVLNFTGKKIFFAKFLSEKKRKQLINILNKIKFKH